MHELILHIKKKDFMYILKIQFYRITFGFTFFC